MKVKDLIEEIERCKVEYNDFLEWDIYTEQIPEVEKQNHPEDMVSDSEGWEYFRCFGFWTKFPDKRIFTINVNY